MERIRFENLLVCSTLVKDNVLALFFRALSFAKEPSYAYEFAAKIIPIAEELGLSGNILRSYVVYRLAHDENIVSRMVEMNDGKIGKSLERAFLNDMEILTPIFEYKPSDFLPFDLLDDYVPTKKKTKKSFAYLFSLLNLPWSPQVAMKSLLEYFQRYGYADIAIYRTFCWNNDEGLVGIRHFDPVLLKDLIGYEHQKQELTANTLAFLGGKAANNVLLIGPSGTGKSSSVKALANEFFEQGLRLLELTKAQLADLPRIFKVIRRFSGKKFIIFLDDISFDENDVEYKCLKSAIEGGVNSRPLNVLIYATSDRRDLLYHSKIEGMDNNKVAYRANSLVARFGIKINYNMPEKNEYMAILDYYFRKEGILLSPEELEEEVAKWEKEHATLTGRSAQQFVNYYLSTH